MQPIISHAGSWGIDSHMDDNVNYNDLCSWYDKTPMPTHNTTLCAKVDRETWQKVRKIEVRCAVLEELWETWPSGQPQGSKMQRDGQYEWWTLFITSEYSFKFQLTCSDGWAQTWGWAEVSSLYRRMLTGVIGIWRSSGIVISNWTRNISITNIQTTPTLRVFYHLRQNHEASCLVAFNFAYNKSIHYKIRD